MKKKNIILLILTSIIILSIVIFNSGLLSITETVSASKYDYNSIIDAKSACEQQKLSISSSQNCGQCLVMCPKAYTTLSGTGYTVKYPTDNTRYSGNFYGVNCDFVGSTYVKSGTAPTITETSGGLLEVKSFCTDTVKVCEKQVSTTTIVSTGDIPGGQQTNYLVTIENRDCTTNKYIGTESSKKYYEIKCDSGYYVSGKSFTDNIYMLGECIEQVTLPVPNDINKDVLDNKSIIIPSGDAVIVNPINTNATNKDATPSDNIEYKVSIIDQIKYMFDFENNTTQAILTTVLSLIIVLGLAYISIPKKVLKSWGIN